MLGQVRRLPSGLTLGPMRDESIAAGDVAVQGRLRSLIGRLFRTQEKERRDLARELHDDISQRLARLEMDVYEFERSPSDDPEVNRERLGKIREGIAAASAVIRAISHRLYPSIVEDLGLGSGLRALVEDFRRRDRLDATYSEKHVPDRIPPDVTTQLYRIAEEALRNVVQHAGNARVTVTLEGAGSGLHLAIADTGRGFNPVEMGSALGLIALQERMREIGATVRIESKPGAGTRVTVELPAAALT